MRFKRLLALLLAAALALAVLVGCGSGQQSAAQALLALLDGKYPNISIEIDPDLEADLRQAVNEGETDAEIRAALEKLLGSGVNFRLIGDGQKGDSAWNLILYPGSDPDAAARSAYLEWDKIFSAFPSSGLYTAKLSMIETENGYAILVKATVDKAARRNDDDDDEPEEPEDPGYTDDGEGNYTVTTADGLLAWNKAVQGNLSLNCTLADNIDLTGKDWTPIGTNFGNSYTGTFDGGNYTITGLTVTGSDQYAGLFGYIGENGTVKNVVLEGVKITSDKSSGYVGGVAGYSYGKIENCSVSGSVSGSGSSSDVGGVVGYQVDGSITGCSSSATVKGTQRAGGMAGATNSSATLTACYATGDVTVENDGPNNAYAGGVVGSNGGSSTLIACYATGNVTGTGTGTDPIYVGGVTGSNNSGTLTACYWSGMVKDEDGKETNAGIGSGSGQAIQVTADGGDDPNAGPVNWNTALGVLNNPDINGTGYTFGGDMDAPILKKQ